MRVCKIFLLLAVLTQILGKQIGRLGIISGKQLRRRRLSNHRFKWFDLGLSVAPYMTLCRDVNLKVPGVLGHITPSYRLRNVPAQFWRYKCFFAAVWCLTDFFSWNNRVLLVKNRLPNAATLLGYFNFLSKYCFLLAQGQWLLEIEAPLFSFLSQMCIMLLAQFIEQASHFRTRTNLFIIRK